MRASTPSNAAELAVNDEYADKKKAEYLAERLNTAFENIINTKRRRLKTTVERPDFKKPWLSMEEKQRKIDYLTEKMEYAAEKSNTAYEHRLAAAAAKLDALSPLNVLKRGYSFTENAERKVITSVNDVENGSMVSITLNDGMLNAVVKDKVIFDGKEKTEL